MDENALKDLEQAIDSFVKATTRIKAELERLYEVERQHEGLCGAHALRLKGKDHIE